MDLFTLRPQNISSSMQLFERRGAVMMVREIKKKIQTMDQNTKCFPEFLFPRPETEHVNERQLFADFGSISAVNIIQNDKSLDVCCQRLRSTDHWNDFCARRPTLPLIRHNECVLDEPCMADITAKKNRLMSLCNLLKRKKGSVKIKQKVSAIRKIMKSLARKYPDYFVDELPSNSLDDLAVDDNDEDSEDDGEYDEDVEDEEMDKEQVISELPPNYDKLYAPVSKISKLVSLNLLKYPTQEESMFEEDCLDLLINSNYTGGCLSCQKLPDDNGVVFFVKGPRMNQLHSLPVHIDCHHLSVLESESCIYEHSTEIYQVDSVYLHHEVYVGSRTGDTCTLVKLCPTEQGDLLGEETSEIEVQEMKTRQLDAYSCSEEQLMSIALSPYIPGEVMMTCKREGLGLVKIWSPGVQPELLLDQHEPQFPVKNDWIHCYYASHPRNITVADRAGISLYDVRASPSHSVYLLNLRKCGLNQNERVMASKRHPDQPFYHIVATDYSVLLLDERFPNHQVVQWYHTLLSHPQYIDVVSDVHSSTREQLLLVAGQAVPETLAYPLSMNVGKSSPPYGAGSCWRISRTDDFVHFATRQGAILSGILTDTPLIGMCGLNHCADEGGLSVLQLSSTGNLFCQDYEFRSTCCGDKTQAFGVGSQNVHLNVDDRAYISKWLMDYESYLTTTRKMKCTEDLSWVMEGVMNDQVVPHIRCPTCPKLYTDQVAAPDIVDDDYSMCYNCRIKLKASRSVRDCALKNVISPHLRDEAAELPSHIQQLDLSSPEQFDLTSQIIQKLWNDEDVIELVKKRDEEVTMSRKERFEKWKEKKLAELSTKELDGSNDDEGDTSLNQGTSEDVSGDEASRDLSDQSVGRRHDSDSQLKSSRLTSPRKRCNSISSHGSSIGSVSSRHSLQGFGSIPSRIKKQSLKSPDSLISTPVKKHHGSSPGHPTHLPSPVRSPTSSFASPPPSHKKKRGDTQPPPSPISLFSSALLKKKSAKLLRKGSPSRKKRPQFPGFL